MINYKLSLRAEAAQLSVIFANKYEASTNGVRKNKTSKRPPFVIQSAILGEQPIKFDHLHPIKCTHSQPIRGSHVPHFRPLEQATATSCYQCNSNNSSSSSLANSSPSSQSSKVHEAVDAKPSRSQKARSDCDPSSATVSKKGSSLYRMIATRMSRLSKDVTCTSPVLGRSRSSAALHATVNYSCRDDIQTRRTASLHSR